MIEPTLGTFILDWLKENKLTCWDVAVDEKHGEFLQHHQGRGRLIFYLEGDKVVRWRHTPWPEGIRLMRIEELSAKKPDFFERLKEGLDDECRLWWCPRIGAVDLGWECATNGTSAC
jgi:hypothetical protein